MSGMTLNYNVLENGARDLILEIVGVDTTTTVAYTSETAITGIIAAAMTATSQTYTPSVHNKIKRIIYNCTNCAIRLQWHATTNTELITVSGYGEWNAKDCQGIIDNGGAGVTGDIDWTTIPIAAVSSGAGIVTAAASLQIYLIKGA
jgi:hypothetical protein